MSTEKYHTILQEKEKKRAALQLSVDPTDPPSIKALWRVSDGINASPGSLLDNLDRWLWHGEFVPKITQVDDLM